MKNFLSIAASLLVAMPAIAGPSSYSAPAGNDATAAFAAVTPIDSYNNRVELTEAPEGWKLLGTGHLTDGAISEFLGYAKEWDVQVLQSETDSNVYALYNAWTDGNCPWNSDGSHTINATADCLIQFDCTDPDDVGLYPDSYQGVYTTNIKESFYGEFLLNAWYGGSTGTFYDNKITFPAGQMWFKRDSKNNCKSTADFIVEIPVATVEPSEPDYHLTVTAIDLCAEGGKAHLMIDAGADAVVKYYVFPGKRDYMDAFGNAVAGQGSVIEPGEQLITTGYASDWATIFLVSLDPNDALRTVQAGTAVSVFCHAAHNDADWTLLGAAKYTDDTFLEEAVAPYDVQMYESTSTPGLYCIEDMFANHPSVVSGDVKAITSHKHYVEIDATNPAAVKIKNSLVGVEINGNLVSMISDQDGTLSENGLITFPTNGLEYVAGNYFYANKHGRFAIQLPGYDAPVEPDYHLNVSIDGICFDNNTATVKVDAGEDLIVKYLHYPATRNIDMTAAAMLKAAGSVIPSNEFTVNIGSAKTWSTILVMGFAKDENGEIGEAKAVGGKQVFTHPSHVADDWTMIGKAKFTDDLILDEEIATYEVDVFESKSTKGLYHVYNLYANHPFVANGEFKALDHDHYVEIDATDPSAVKINESVVGVEIEGETLFLSSKSNGTLSSTGLITFPAKGLEIFTDTNYPANNYGRFALQLPGFDTPAKKDYSFNVSSTGFCTDDNKLVFTVEAGTDVAQVKWAWAGGYYYEGTDNNLNIMEANASVLNELGTTTLDLSNNPGWSTLFLMAYDAEGSRVGGDVVWYYSTPAMVESEWKLLGKGTLKDDTFTADFEELSDIDIVPYEVDVYQNVKSSSLYRIVDPYKNHPLVKNGTVAYHAEHPHYLDINASAGNDHVTIPAAPTGIEYKGYHHALLSFYEGKIDENNLLTFPAEGLTNLYQNGEYIANYNGNFSIQLPKTTQGGNETEVPEYEVELSASSICFEDGVVNLTVRKGSAITDVWVANLTGRRDASPAYMNAIKSLGSHVDAGTFAQPSPVASGWVTFFAVAADETGDLVDIKAVQIYEDGFNDYDWRELGEGKIVDSTFGTATGKSDDEHSYSVKVYESFDNEGVYRFEDPFANHPVVDKATFHPHVHYIEVDASNFMSGEKYATIDFQPTGINHDGKDIVIRSRNKGVVSDGVITFSGMYIEYSAANKTYTPSAESKLRFVLPNAVGIESIETEVGTNDDVIYDLSGRRVSKINHKGLYIINGQKQVVR